MQPVLLSAKLAFLVVLSLLSPSPAQAESSWMERREIAYARRSFQDSLYNVSEMKLKRFIENRPQSDFRDEARWLLGQSYYFLGNYDQALEVFTNLPKPKGEDDAQERNYPAEFLFWQARTLTAKGHYLEGTERFQKYLNDYPDEPRIANSRLGLSTCLHQLGKTEEASAALEPLLTSKEGTPDKQRALLKLLQFKLAEKKYQEAAKQMAALKSEPVLDELKYDIAYWSGMTSLQVSDEAKAIEFFETITSDNRANPRSLVTNAWLGKGKAYQALEDWTEAQTAFSKAYSVSLDRNTIQDAVLQYLEACYLGDNLAKGAIEVRKFAAKNPDYAQSGLIAIGQYYYNDGNYDAAISEMDNLIQKDPKSRWVWSAQLLIARSFDAKGDSESAVSTYQQIIDGGENVPPSIAVYALEDFCRFHFTNENFEEAAVAFQQLANTESASAKKRELAYLSALKARAALNQIEEFETLEVEYAKTFPDTVYLADSLMLKAHLYQRAGKDEDARGVFNKIIESQPDSEQAADALFALGRSYFESGVDEQAISTFRLIEQNHPQYSQITETIYLRILAELNNGQLDYAKAREQLNSLSDGFPDSPLQAKIRFKSAFTLVEEGRYLDAITELSQIIDLYPKSAEAEYAAYLAGRSAMRLDQHQDAIGYFEKIPTESTWKTHGHLAQIRCYMVTGQFEVAHNLADAIIKKTPPGTIQSEALIRKADCMIAQASGEEDSYLEAFEAVQSVISSKQSSVAQRNEAGFLKGKILQKQDKNNEALEAYLDVVYRKLLPADLTQSPSNPEYHFFIESGVAAAQMLKDEGNIRGAVEVYRILSLCGTGFGVHHRDAP
ncbi:MAG: tetratricopeptide repeat protein, partial [Verrucomicrobiota bacterium]